MEGKRTFFTWPTPRLAHIYNNMRYRCYNPARKDYRFYGGKGIGVCEEWLNDPAEFALWAISNGYNDTLTIDRVDSTKWYCPENCRWVDSKTNNKLKRTTRLITIGKVTDSLSGWAARIGIPKMTLVHAAVKRTDEEVVEYIKARANIG